MTRRILGQLVVRNEADRYLDCVLNWHAPILDGIHVYDDRSTDSTLELAKSHGCEVSKRSLNAPSFLEHEGRFREEAWRQFEVKLQPTVEDWVLAFDADEFLVARADEQGALHDLCAQAEAQGAVAVTVPIPEVWAVTEAEGGGVTTPVILTDPQVRVDGFWGQIVGYRLFRYRPDGVWKGKAMACGSEPTYVEDAGPSGWYHQTELALLHYGYAFPGDQAAKYARYNTVAGHADQHIQSIAQPPVLARWFGPTIDVWKGHAGR